MGAMMRNQGSGHSGGQASRSRPRRRGAVLLDALLQAAWEELSAAGYARVTMEGVATRAGTHKSVLYRRWPNRATVVQAAVRHRLGSLADDVPDTGDLREDVLSVLRRFRDYAEAIGPDTARGLASEAADLPPEVLTVTPGVITAILQRAARRGEVRPDRITPRITALPGNLLRHELLVPHGDLSDATLTGIIDEIFLPIVVTATPSA
jgi:AcrR family transcriptional regulator